ncbi:hypothetical protein Ferp_2201 [Ferroglobus placidus DSM 10642]|uniref:Uncharacterized protein n=1 Tax=Ferroglobus placidus (strain DSM 10642 / AEDII12DO) TaxID=589924 RepID=D3S0T9_FERPA|nr:hypothetical protein [Ferroglobus placidus]ADC66330.1 hypothetical protein Ferp_2201 [Ferroglobus placidus DSM 10642]
MLEGLEEDEFYNEHHDYHFHELLIETIVDLLAEKGLNKEDVARLKRIVESRNLIGEDLAFYDDVEIMKKVCELDYEGKVEILKTAKNQELLPYAVKFVRELIEKGGREEL